MKLAVVGITGLVGSVILEVLEELSVPVSEFIPVASENSVGKQVVFRNSPHVVKDIQEAITMKPDIAIFSAGASTSLKYAPEFAKVGTFVIDNSSAWRMHENVKLIVPEINADTLTKSDKIIANPNCSTIQMVMALAPLHKLYGIKRLVISTYQSFTGTGVKAVKQYELEKKGLTATDPAYPYKIFENCIPHCDIFYENGYTKEELKLVNETRKILDDDSIRITATAVRVPVSGGHSESVNVEFYSAFDLANVKYVLSQAKGIQVMDDPEKNIYPMPMLASGRNEVFVGRLRRDESVDNGLNMWIVADNLRKGAATNALQIAQYLYTNGLVRIKLPA